jgi:hypothetical protein
VEADSTGQGLEAPWSRQQSADTIGLGISAPQDSALSSPYLSPPDARDYLGPSFPSPSATVDDIPLTDPASHQSPDQPQRAGTWAANLRTTLFAAISGVGANSRAGPDQQEDKFTRQVLPLHRNSTRRNLQNGNTSGRASSQAFPIVMEVKDHDSYMMPALDAEVIGSVYLAPSISTSSNDSRYPVMPIRRPKKMPLRGSAGERYKAAYARSRGGASSVDEESSAESSGGWSLDDRVPSRLAGGQRARGVRG